MKKVLLTESEYRKVCSILNEKECCDTFDEVVKCISISNGISEDKARELLKDKEEEVQDKIAMGLNVDEILDDLVFNVDEKCCFKSKKKSKKFIKESEDEKFTTTFMQDFAIADRFGVNAVKDTFKRAFAEWKTDYKYLTDLVIVLNQRCWMWYDKGNMQLSKVYSDLYYKAHHYAQSHLKGEEFDYYFQMTD